MVKRTLVSMLESLDLAELAGVGPVARGMGYLDDERVEVRDRDDRRVDAVVRGTVPYDVTLSVRGSTLDWLCTCPAAEDGSFCKHCVAVALACMPAPREPSMGSGFDTQENGDDLRSFVESLDADELVDLVIEQAENDWKLRERLAARARRAAGLPVDAREWRRLITNAFGSRRFIDYRAAPEWAAGVNEVLGQVEELLDEGHAAEVIGLVEHAHARTERAMQRIDDSDGWITMISGTIADLHFRACELAAPDPVALARRLADHDLKDELDTWRRAAVTYADVLGPEGLAEYRRKIEPAWRAHRDDTYRWSTERFRAQHAMVGVILAERDPDELIRVMAGDLGTPTDYEEIAALLRSCARTDEAIEWSRRGLAAFADRHWQTPPLRELLGEMLRERGADDEALAVWWDAFERAPSVESYRRILAEVAKPERNALGTRAIEALRLRVAENELPNGNPLLTVAPVAALVEILLYEGDVDGAWSAAEGRDLDERRLLKLAAAREKSHPLDVVPIYAAAASSEISRKDNHGYRKGVVHLERVRTLLVSAGRPEQFEALLADVRTSHSAKRNLMAMLDKKGW